MGYIESLRKKLDMMRSLRLAQEYLSTRMGKYCCKGEKITYVGRCIAEVWEVGETVEETAKRELFEETGLTANSLELLGVFSGEELRYTYPNGDRTCIVEILYICRDFAGVLLPEKAEILELKWFDINNLPKEISPPDRNAFLTFSEYIKREELAAGFKKSMEGI